MAPLEPHEDHEHGTTGRDVTLALVIMVMLGCVLATLDPPPPADVNYHSVEIAEVAP